MNHVDMSFLICSVSVGTEIDALKLINLYVYRYEPSRNNKTRAVITYTNPSTWFSAPVIVNYTMTYDDQGFVNSLSSDSFSAGDAPFYSINYECQ